MRVWNKLPDSIRLIFQATVNNGTFITLRASCGAVCCNRSCLFVRGWVGGSVIPR